MYRCVFKINTGSPEKNKRIQNIIGHDLGIPWRSGRFGYIKYLGDADHLAIIVKKSLDDSFFLALMPGIPHDGNIKCTELTEEELTKEKIELLKKIYL